MNKARAVFKDLRMRNRTILLLFLPVAFFLFAAGWLLYFYGDRTRECPPQRQQASIQNIGIQIQVAAPEESEQYNY